MSEPARRAPHEELIGWRAASERRVFVRDLELVANIGVHPHEYEAPQPVTVSIELQVAGHAPSASNGRPPLFAPPPRADDPASALVVCYESLTNAVRDIVTAGHIDYVETFAERIAETCLKDPRVLEARIRIEKPRAIADASGAGVEILRRR